MSGIDGHDGLRQSVREVCEQFPDAYWRALDATREYPEEFVRAMSEKRYLAALIPEEYGGLGVDLSQASVILEEINRSGGNARPPRAGVPMGPCSGTLEEQRGYLPNIARRAQARPSRDGAEPAQTPTADDDRVRDARHSSRAKDLHPRSALDYIIWPATTPLGR